MASTGHWKCDEDVSELKCNRNVTQLQLKWTSEVYHWGVEAVLSIYDKVGELLSISTLSKLSPQHLCGLTCIQCLPLLSQQCRLVGLLDTDIIKL